MKNNPKIMYNKWLIMNTEEEIHQEKNVLLFCLLKSQDNQWEFDVKIIWKLWSRGHRRSYLRYFKRKTTSHPSCLIIQFTSKLPQEQGYWPGHIYVTHVTLRAKVGRDRKEQGQNHLVSLACVKDPDPSLALSPGHCLVFRGKRFCTPKSKVLVGVVPPCH